MWYHPAAACKTGATMPSPFPGMDPYLEDPARWPDVHLALIAEIRTALNDQLRPRYFARVEERVYLSDEADPGRSVIVPDVRVMASPRQRPRRQQSEAAVAMALLDEPEPIEVTTLFEEEVREARLQILDQSDRSVVAVIEVLSPTNKVAGSAGRESYVEKRREVMASSSHLVEIDLLRAGISIYPRERLPEHQYLVHVSKHMNDTRRRAWVWPIRLPQRLPTIPIPLRGNDPDAQLHLQDVLGAAYSHGAYEVDLDYTRDPVPPLDGEQAAWARQLPGVTAKLTA